MHYEQLLISIIQGHTFDIDLTVDPNVNICTEVPHNTEGWKGTGSDFVWGSWMYLISAEQGKTSSYFGNPHLMKDNGV